MSEKKKFSKFVNEGQIEWRKHALERMISRGISRNDVLEVLLNGEVIERYDDSKPFPSMLISGKANGRAIHVVVAHDVENERQLLITVYEPDRLHFGEDLKTRKKR
jgi:hypothetical protein